MTTWLIATRSLGKLAELRPMLREMGVSAMSLDDAGVVVHADEDGIECFDTFEENALAKARYFSARTGMPCLADDSGLCIVALDGAPGVRSRRFAENCGQPSDADHDQDAANNDAMLDACWDSGRAPPWHAHFACSAAFSDGTREVVATGRTDGVITPEPDGTGGFGYDPFFRSAELGVSFACATRAVKAAVSHRHRAVAALLKQLGSQP